MMLPHLEGSRVEYDGHLWALLDIDFIHGRAWLTRAIVPMEKYETVWASILAIGWP
ncbi:hypothetical protein SEA_LUCHADOR_40 [Mycobacterium phage Luchador]|uniref:Uncharacterized protein n=1 Tax=Mycobacterium phage Luchador TaxID=1647300 RepID=A0A0F6WDL1_9CAUD|nr:hypothetical protein AVT52_gp64 [Mycobacterium phage Luchador]AKF14204.1 hypothetical protein SEA_LUCHADOR_40 [Mycobacterium phage Luchador]